MRPGSSRGRVDKSTPPRNFYARQFKPAVRRALPADLHGLRSTTCAALLIAEGAHPKAIQQRPGHSSITHPRPLRPPVPRPRRCPHRTPRCDISRSPFDHEERILGDPFWTRSDFLTPGGTLGPFGGQWTATGGMANNFPQAIQIEGVGVAHPTLL